MYIAIRWCVLLRRGAVRGQGACSGDDTVMVGMMVLVQLVQWRGGAGGCINSDSTMKGDG